MLLQSGWHSIVFCFRGHGTNNCDGLSPKVDIVTLYHSKFQYENTLSFSGFSPFSQACSCLTDDLVHRDEAQYRSPIQRITYQEHASSPAPAFSPMHKQRKTMLYSMVHDVYDHHEVRFVYARSFRRCEPQKPPYSLACGAQCR